ncbi:MAG: hypothetical protein R2800_02910 [Flavipsychrobacter sp.]
MDERIKKLQSYLEQSPNDCFLNHALALEYIKIGKDEEARGQFEKNRAYDANYVATYYHLAKLLERMGDEDEAIKVYEQGMVVAKEQGDTHSFSELRSAYEELTF